MKLYSSNEQYKLYNGNMLDLLEVIEENSIDSIITDPPYELNFMNKGWDNSGIAFKKEAWEKCYKVLKSGGYLLAFGGSRTFHRIACAIEDAGFEIRDVIMWLYGSGFPKSMNIGLAIDKKNGVDNRTGKVRTNGSATGSIVTTGTGDLKREYEERKAQNEWAGWGTCLKPAYEPIIVARKPVENSIIDNVMKYGVGGINIDECRIGDTGAVVKTEIIPNSASKNCGFGCDGKQVKLNKGRFPSNVILTYDETDFDEVCGAMPYTNSTESMPNHEKSNCETTVKIITGAYKSGYHYGDDGNASRYFYCAKASKFDRDEGLEMFEERNVMCDRNPDLKSADMPQTRSGNMRKNIHPTVKPCELMRYLVRLVSPKGATILDCFNGSGSTGKAVMLENKEFKKDYKYIGIELTEEYLPLSKARIEYICNNEFDFTKEKRATEENKIYECNLFDYL